jgi:hypothetical protein
MGGKKKTDYSTPSVSNADDAMAGNGRPLDIAKLSGSQRDVISTPLLMDVKLCKQLVQAAEVIASRDGWQRKRHGGGYATTDVEVRRYPELLQLVTPYLGLISRLAGELYLAEIRERTGVDETTKAGPLEWYDLFVVKYKHDSASTSELPVGSEQGESEQGGSEQGGSKGSQRGLAMHVDGSVVSFQVSTQYPVPRIRVVSTHSSECAVMVNRL